MKLLILLSLFTVGCGGAEAQQASASVGLNDNVNIGGSEPTAPSCPGLLSTQFMIPCPKLTGHYPEILIKDGNSVVLMTQLSNNQVGFTARPMGDYVTQDGRNCNYTVNVDGSLQ